MRIILASTSPRRKELLQKIGLKFRTVGPKIEEKLNPRLKPRSNAELLSLEKAKAVAVKHADAVIIAADTFIVYNDEILGKPENENHARRILQKLSGKELSVITGFTVMHTGMKKTYTASVETKVYFKKLTKKDIEWYVRTGEYKGAAGAFRIQEKGSVLVDRIDGDFYNIVGLPVSVLVEELKKIKVEL